MTIDNLTGTHLNNPSFPIGKTDIQIIDRRNDSSPCLFILKGYLGIIITPNAAGHLGISLIENREENKGVCWEHVTWLWSSDIQKYQELLTYTQEWIENNTIQRDSYHYFI